MLLSVPKRLRVNISTYYLIPSAPLAAFVSSSDSAVPTEKTGTSTDSMCHSVPFEHNFTCYICSSTESIASQ